MRGNYYIVTVLVLNKAITVNKVNWFYGFRLRMDCGLVVVFIYSHSCLLMFGGKR